MLLAIRDDKGTFASDFAAYAVAGAVLAELLFDRRITVDEGRRKLVNLKNRRRVGDPIIDECLAKLKAAKRRASLGTWVSRFAGIRKLRHKVAQQLCARGILRNEEDKVLLFFTRKVYPEINPKPEREIVERLRKAIFTNQKTIDPRTVVLLSLADRTDLLRQTFGRKEIKARRKRIEQIVSGDLLGEATGEVIAACQAAVMTAAVVPVIAATTN